MAVTVISIHCKSAQCSPTLNQCIVLVQDNGGVIDQFVQIKRPQTNIIKYNIKLGDELLLSTLSLLFPEMYGLQGSLLVHVQSRFNGDADDPHDESYLRQTQRAGVQVKCNF